MYLPAFVLVLDQYLVLQVQIFIEKTKTQQV